MRLLAIDTSSHLLSVALAEDTNILISHATYMERGQGEALIPLIQRLCDEANCPIETVQQVIATVGPGSFTGVRIALATARGIGLSLNIPVIGITNFDALTMPEMPYPLCVALDTKRGDCYTQVFQNDQEATEPKILSPDEVTALKLPVLTDNPALFNQANVQLVQAPECPAENMINVIFRKPTAKRPPEPLYLREADVTVVAPKSVHGS